KIPATLVTGILTSSGSLCRGFDTPWRGPFFICCYFLVRGAFALPLRNASTLTLPRARTLLLAFTRRGPHALALLARLFRQGHAALAGALQHALVVLLTILLALFSGLQTLHGLTVLLQLF